MPSWIQIHLDEPEGAEPEALSSTAMRAGLLQLGKLVIYQVLIFMTAPAFRFKYGNGQKIRRDLNSGAVVIIVCLLIRSWDADPLNPRVKEVKTTEPGHVYHRTAGKTRPQGAVIC